MLDELHQSMRPSSALWTLVQLRHDDLAQTINHSKYCHWQGLVSLFHNTNNTPLEEGECASQVWWVCNVENKIHTEGCYESFIKACTLAHIYSIYFNHTESSCCDCHFPVIVSQLYGWMECRRVPLHRRKTCKRSNYKLTSPLEEKKKEKKGKKNYNNLFCEYIAIL